MQISDLPQVLQYVISGVFSKDKKGPENHTRNLVEKKANFVYDANLEKTGPLHQKRYPRINKTNARIYEYLLRSLVSPL